MAARFVPSKLKNICINKVVECANLHVDRIAIQPAELKDRLLHLMSKRGLLTDGNIGEFIHQDVTELDLSESNISNDGLKKICVCKKLRKLDLNASKGFKSQVSSIGIKQIAEHCKQLEIVFLRRCTLIDDDAVIELSKCCCNLTQLNVEGCTGITDASLGSIAKHCVKMTSLNVSKTKVTDVGMRSLSNGCCAKQLKEIHVSCCEGISDIGINLLLDSCPRLQILIFHGCPLVTGQSRERLQTREMRQITWTVY